MKTLGVDLGRRRVGLAVSDPEGMIAFPLRVATVSSPEEALEAVLCAASEEQAGQVVVGHPRKMNGRRGPDARAAEAFAEHLVARGIERVALWDERLTTAEVTRALKAEGLSRRQQVQHVDALAAQRLLSSFLDAQARKDPQGPSAAENV
jgi:putative holliday junction resolvase